MYLQNSGCPPIRLTQVQAKVYSPGVKSSGMTKVYSSGDWPSWRLPSIFALGHLKLPKSVSQQNIEQNRGVSISNGYFG
jgi:hypothetical protein